MPNYYCRPRVQLSVHQQLLIANDFRGRDMKRFYSVVAAIAIGASSLPGQNIQNVDQSSDRNIEIQLAAVDTALKFWTAEGRLKGKKLVVDSRPALSSIDGSRRLPEGSQKRPAARSADATLKIASVLGARPATTDEITPCVSGRGCQYTPDLAMLIIGEPVIEGDTVTVVVGVSVVHEDRRGNLRPAATYQSISMVLLNGVWRPIQMKLAGQG
jgi:hypothetical protein